LSYKIAIIDSNEKEKTQINNIRDEKDGITEDSSEIQMIIIEQMILNI
jgi:hypothetical protein